MQIVKEQILEQIDKIGLELQKIMNQIQSHPLDFSSHLKLWDSNFNLDFIDLLDISKKLSQQIVIGKQKIKYQKPNPDPQKGLEKIKQGIQALKDCTIKIAEIMNLQDPRLEYYNYINPILEYQVPGTIRNVKYKQLFQQQIPFNVTQIQFQLNGYHKYIAVADDNEKEERYLIHIMDLENENKQFNFSKTLTIHRQKVVILYLHCFIYSVDQERQINAWTRCMWQKTWVLYMQFDLSTLMNQISCLLCNDKTNQLIMGGDILFAQNVDCKSKTQKIKSFINYDDSVQCLDSNLQGEILISGSKQGNISVFSYSKYIWQEILNLAIFQHQVRYVKFLTKTDFITIHKNNLYIKWKHDKTLQQYEYKKEYIQDLDRALIFQNFFVQPFMSISNEQIKLIEFDLCAHDLFGEHLVLVKNNVLKIFGARQIL